MNTLMWFRRDLRTADHPALSAAIAHAARTGGSVTAIFVLDDRLIRTSGPNRIAVLFDALRSLRTAGVPLRILAGDPTLEVPMFADQLGADVYATADHGPYGSVRDRSVDAALRRIGSTLHLIDSPYVVPPGTVLKDDGTPFRVFTPFKRVWLEHARGQRPYVGSADSIMEGTLRWSHDGELGDIPDAPTGMSAELPTGLPEMSERTASKAAEVFLAERVGQYVETRNIPGLDATSRLSVYLKYGVLHPRQLLEPLEEQIAVGSAGAAMFLSELCWREFYADVLFHRPESARRNFVQTMDIEVDSGALADVRFAAWCDGRTGFPFIDAGMRQLLAEGWMHNRVRMAVASFLVKDLHLPWQRGARWFMRQLVDGDIASNQHGWQWTAGTGTDAAPYFRIFNPVTQGKKFDPDGVYIKRWIPELRPLSAAAVHEPWLHRPSAQLFDPTGGDEGGPDSYPDPIVDHAAERAESMRRLRAIRGK